MELSTAAVRQTARGILASAWLHPLNDAAAVDDLLAQVSPLWSLGRIRARVVALIPETPAMRTIVLAPNRHWPGFRAGQYVAVEVEIRGVRHHRAYSLSSAPGYPSAIAITVKRHPGGTVSGYLHDVLAVGDVLGLGAPAGGFVLPEPVPPRLLLLSAGSGITPVMSILRDLQARGHRGDVRFVHVCRTAADAPFRDELRAAARAWPALDVVHVLTAVHGRLDAAALTTLVPDWATRLTFVCGPTAFMAMVQERWRRDGNEDRLRSEDFGGLRPTSAVPGIPVAVHCTRSATTFATTGDRPLLAAAEAAGLAPPHGCRMGICQTCRCRKLAGVVENLVSGAVSSEPDEMIQLCVSVPRSDVTLAI